MASPLLTGVVKQVISGDTIVIRDKPKNKSPNEKTIVLMNITAPRPPKIGKIKLEGEDTDEPYGWEAREFLRKKLIGQKVDFFSKPFPNNTNSSDREIGKIFFPTKDDDIIEEIVANGLAKVKKEKASGKQGQDPDIKKLLELEEKARQENKGLWSKDKEKHVRNVKYIKEFSRFVTEHGKKPISAIIEQVRDGQLLMMLDLILLPDFYYIHFAISGIKFLPECDEYKKEAKFFIECRLLQQDDVKVVIEKSLNNYVTGSVLHPKGDIAVLLLQEGFVGCDDRTMMTVTMGASKLRNAETYAKNERLRCWRNRQVEPKAAKEEFQAIVMEIFVGEALTVKVVRTGELKKIFLSSIRAPKEQKKEGTEEIIPKEKTRLSKTMFDVPWLFETREFLRKKLIGKRVNVIVDYIQPAKDDFPEKICCSVFVGGTNIAEALVQNGLATVVRYRQDEENRSSCYDALLIAEQKAIDSQTGLHSKVEAPKHRVTDCSGNRATGLFPMLQKANKKDAVVEFVMSGSRMKLFIPKDSLMLTFLLSGIYCPRPGINNKVPGRSVQPAEPFGEEALNFTKERIFQRQVEIRIEQHDKVGSMIGSLFIGNTNLALALVEEGLASVHIPSADRSLIQAEKVAKEKKIGIWQNGQEDKRESNDDDIERVVNYKDIIVTNVSPELHIYALHKEQKVALNELEEKLRADLAANPPVGFTKDRTPFKGKLYAAKYAEDNLWYRAKVEKIMGKSNCKAVVNFIDYGNRETVPFENLAPLPDTCSAQKPFAHEYGLACMMAPPEHYLQDVVVELLHELEKRNLRINIEYTDHNFPYVSVTDAETNEDCIKTCISKGMFYVQKRREKKLQSLIKEYEEAQNEAQKTRLFIWEYGDARADDAKEFGLGK